MSSTTTTTVPTGTRLTQQQQHHDRGGAVSPADSVSSVGTAATMAGTKRKERDFESSTGAGDVSGGAGGVPSTNINVVVRCRGRNDREVRENSAVVVSTEGAKGKLIGLSMGPNAVSDKTYNFDRVFSQAADQSMIFDDVVKPILEEVSFRPFSFFPFTELGTGRDSWGRRPQERHAARSRDELTTPRS